MTSEITAESKDETLVRAYLQTREEELFDELYRRYASKIYGRCLSLLNDEVLAQDAVQEIFMKIILNLSKFGEKSKFSTWVYSITYNGCIDIIRKRKKRLLLETPEETISEDFPEEVDDQFVLEVEVDRLKVILEKIDEDDKAVLLMKYLEEMSIKEMAEALSKSESAVKMKIKRAKHRFKLMYHQLFLATDE